MSSTRRRGGVGLADAGRILFGLGWLGGAVFHALWTRRHPEIYRDYFATASPIPAYRWFFRRVVSARPALWTALVIAGELGLGALTLSRGALARLGIIGGITWSALLIPVAWPYTAFNIPYTLLQLPLLRRHYERHASSVIRDE